MKQTSVSILAFFLVVSCAAQQPQLDSSLAAVMGRLQRASQVQDAQQYASVFTENATWQGPLGQSAIGPANIQRAAGLMLTTFGPLNTREWQAKQLGPDFRMVEMFQGNAASNFRKTVPTAPGSGTPPNGSSLRTTLILRKVEGQWRIIAAELADIRVPEQRAIVAVN